MLKRYFLGLALLIPGVLFCQVNTSGFNHLALSVKDIEASTVFYRDVLGLKPIEVPDDLKAIRSWFEFGGGQDLHLLAGRKDPVSNNDRNGAHFALSIQNADDVEAVLIEKKVAYHRQQRFDGAWQIYITDPDGYVIELNEPRH
ncbi:MAG TPA: VOC family protein [Saprospiraceae bacterium]|nr:VOC family protein [Saprospiraceae bacterium]HMQ81406.1 VOC family protein [Saprospiraceae bacterium]